MPFTRRETLQFGIAGIAGLSATTFMPFTARAAGKADSYKTDSGAIGISPVSHASFVMTTPGLTSTTTRSAARRPMTASRRPISS